MTTSPDVERLANLRAAKDLMDRSYAEALDLGAIAREAGYSRFHFIRGVQFLQEPADRPYGVEAVFRDDSETGSA